MSFALRLTEDRLGAGARLTFPRGPRVLYARETHGALTLATRPPSDSLGLASGVERPAASHSHTGSPRPSNRPAASHSHAHRLAAGTAWHGAADVVLVAIVWRFELIRAAAVDGRATEQSESRRVLEHAIDLDPAQAWLMRCDRVDFAPGGVALPHGHKGAGIRCLLAGTLEVSVGDRPPRLMHPGDAWFESGREPVLAKASPETDTAFVRVSILPREIRGQSSIVYVDPADAGRGRPRQYTVYVDEPLVLP